MRGPRPGFTLLRRCALGLWLCAIALLGVMEFRRAAYADGGFALNTPAWLWLAGSTVTGVVGVLLLLRELHRHCSRRAGGDQPRKSGA